jgi:hypothetical protein
VRRFETPTAVNHGRAESKKDIPMLGSLGCVTNNHRASANGKERYLFKELKARVLLVMDQELGPLPCFENQATNPECLY